MEEILTLGIDIETFSSVDIGECGSHKYFESPDFRILLFSYCVNGGEVKCVDFAQNEVLPPEIYKALWDSKVEKTAYNAAFERNGIGTYFGQYCPPEQWSCTMVLAASCGLPLSLKAAGAAMHLPEDKAKMKEGAELIRYFCQPCRPTKTNGHRTVNSPADAPDKWEVFKQYNIRDVEVETAIREKLILYRQSFIEHKLWCLDQRINDKGVKVDLLLAENAIHIGDDYKDRLLEEARGISGLDNPNSTEQIKKWLEEQEGVTVNSINKKEIAEVICNLKTDEAKKFMTLREQFSKSSTKKYEAVIRCACKDEHVKGCFQFYGASTGRWSGRLLQLQNLPQNHMEDLDVARELVKQNDESNFELFYPNVTTALSELIRTSIIPEKGHRFIVADFSAIEARVIAWMCNEEWRLDVFRNGGDIYCASATQMFKVPVEKHGQNSHLRQKGKVAELALGYGGNINALRAFGAERMGMTEEDMVQTVDLWRQSSPHIVAFWRTMERAAQKCIVHGNPVVTTMGNIRFDYENDILWMTLPSGRRIAYWEPKVETDNKGRNVLTYMSQNQTTHKWERISTWGGKLVENCVQACARDCLANAMLNLTDAGYDIRAHVHDEVIITSQIGQGSVEDVVKKMCTLAPWMDGLPLNADGYECTSYRKD